MYSLALLESVWRCFLVLLVCFGRLVTVRPLQRRVDEQTYSQTDCYVWLKSGIRNWVALASVFSHGSGAPRILRVRGRRFERKENCL